MIRIKWKRQKDLVRQWFPQYVRMKNEENLISWNLGKHASDTRLLAFLARHATDFAPPPSCSIQAMPGTRPLQTTSRLVSLIKSAIWIPEVQDLLSTSRPDVFSSFILSNHSLDGPLLAESEEGKSLRLSMVKRSMLRNLPLAVAKEYTDYYFEMVKNRKMSAQVLTEAMESIMAAPSTDYKDVLQLVDLELDENLLEALLVKIFSIDSPWHVLGSMFTAEAIEHRPARMLASLLGHIQKHVHQDTVVDALELLLQEPRRQSVGVQLKKAIIRCLFDARSEKAKQLLINEWNSMDIHKDVRYVMVKLCVAAILNEERRK